MVILTQTTHVGVYSIVMNPDLKRFLFSSTDGNRIQRMAEGNQAIFPTSASYDESWGENYEHGPSLHHPVQQGGKWTLHNLDPSNEGHCHHGQLHVNRFRTSQTISVHSTCVAAVGGP